jgi:ribosomal protein S18 acetylase RimI-like enzyme
VSDAVTVRPATKADLPTIGELATMLEKLHNELDAKRFIAPTPQTPEGYARFLGTQLEREDAFLLVAEQGGEVVGYAWARIEGFDYMELRGPAGVLEDIVVDPSRRRGGVGQALLDAVLFELRAHDVPQVVLSTADRNEAAQRLFGRAGFRRTMVEMTRELP